MNLVIRDLPYDKPHTFAYVKGETSSRLITSMIDVRYYTNSLAGNRVNLIQQLCRKGLIGKGELKDNYLTIDSNLGEFTIRANTQGYKDLCNDILPNLWKQLLPLTRDVFMTPKADEVLKAKPESKQMIMDLLVRRLPVRPVGIEYVVHVDDVGDVRLSTFDLINHVISYELISEINYY